MKKTIFLLILLTSISYGQKKAISKSVSKPQYVVKIVDSQPTLLQYDFFKTIQLKYPNFYIPEKVSNMYINNELFQSEFSFEDRTGSINMKLEPNNQTIYYEIEIINKDNYTGSYQLWGGQVVKTEIIGQKEYNVYFDGKKEL